LGGGVEEDVEKKKGGYPRGKFGEGLGEVGRPKEEKAAFEKIGEVARFGAKKEWWGTLKKGDTGFKRLR